VKSLAPVFGLAVALAAAQPASAANLQPILMADGNNAVTCDGQWRWMFSVTLSKKVVVGSYLFANLVTDPKRGADLVIWSPVYGGAGTLGDLHVLPAQVGGGRIGDRERWFPAGDGVAVDGPVHVGAACWGGGHMEVYAEIWVKDDK
jgi:hypothetical protein